MLNLKTLTSLFFFFFSFYSSSSSSSSSFYCSRTVATEQREQLVTSEQKLEEIRDDSAKQVLAFREQADVLADETCRSEEAAIQLRGQLRKTQGLLTDAVRTINHLQDELQCKYLFKKI